MAHLYVSDAVTAETCVSGALIDVTGEEARHAVRVARLREGETTMLGNGRGLIATGLVEKVQPDRFTVRVSDLITEAAPSPRVVLVQALAKGDRAERAVEQATEFGIDAIVPWQAERSVSRWDAAKADKGRQKWQRIAREAAKQSLRAWIPEVLPLAKTADLAETAAQPGVRMVLLHPRGAHPLSALQSDGSTTEIWLVVGPEGGFSDAELDRLETAGAEISVLGRSVLRTSSAGPAALAVVNLALGRW